ncbi:MAG TPA: DUF2218 domain-containing protein [Solirubrobacteraceae bacterium]|nr:DUF2218 domain-containing protein [Solirubrobacteraceae bacterium]
MLTSTAQVATAKPGPYMKQLCKHFGHKNEVTFDDSRGEIHLSSGVCALDASAPAALGLRATAADAESLERLTGVIGGHLERFGSRDELSVSWSPPQPAQ